MVLHIQSKSSIKEIKTVNFLFSDHSASDVESERDMLRDELYRLKQMNSNNNTATIPRSVVNAEVSAKLDQVNAWLEVSLIWLSLIDIRNQTQIWPHSASFIGVWFVQLFTFQERATAQDALERVRKENEEARIMEANRKVEEMERELNQLRSGSVLQDFKQERESDLQRELQKSVRDNVVLQENFQK